LPRGDRAVIEVVLQPIPKRFSDVIDKLPPGSWVALTPDRKLVAGMGATKKKRGQPKMRKLITDFTIRYLIKIPDPSGNVE